MQKDHINQAHKIVNQCFGDELENSARTYIDRSMEPGFNNIINKHRNIIKAADEYSEQVFFNPYPKSHQS
jgi:hypothetical protein